MSMFKKLKSIFIIEEEGDTPAEASTPKTDAEVKAQTTTTKSTPSAKPKSAGANAKPDSKFTDMLLHAIEANNIEGFDYLEFKQSLQSLTKVEPDEAKRYKSAFVMAQTMGLDKQKLYDSTQHYIKVLKDEEQKFADAFAKQKSAQVHQREQTVSSLKQTIKMKEAKIKQLQAEIDEATKELAGIEDKINKSLAKVEATKDGFYASYKMVTRQIEKDIERIKTYI